MVFIFISYIIRVQWKRNVNLTLPNLVITSLKEDWCTPISVMSNGNTKISLSLLSGCNSESDGKTFE